MKRASTLVVLAVFVGSSLSAASRRPINDGVSNTLLLTEREGSYTGQGGSGATAEFGETPVGGQSALHTVWYRYIAPANGRLVVEIPDDQGLRAELRLPANPATTIPLQTIADGTSNTIALDEERLSADLMRGQVIYLVVDAGQPFDFSWRFSEVVNDAYRDAESLSGANGTIIRSDQGATLGSFEKGLGFTQPAIWFEWTAPSTGSFYADMVGSRRKGSAEFGPFSLYVYTPSGVVPSTLVGSGSGSTLDNSTRVQFNALEGHVYYFACHGGLTQADNEIWFSWYPAGSAGTLAWAQAEYYVAEADGTVWPRLLKLQGEGAGGIEVSGGAPSAGVAATTGVDYLASGIPISFAATDRTALVPIPITQDGDGEPQESFSLQLASPSGGLGIQDGTSNTIIISEDQQTGACGFPMREIHVREGDSAWIEVRRLRSGQQGLSAGWTVTRSSGRTCSDDLQVISGTAIMGENELSTFIEIPTFQDGEFEGPESFTVSLSSAPLAGAILDGSSNTIVVVEDDDYFVPLAGKYCGLIDTQGWGALVKCTVSGVGGVSGTVDFQGVRSAFKGGIDGAGQMIASFARGSRASLGLRLQFSEGWSRCAVSLRDPEGEWAEGVIRRLPYDGRRSIAPQAGAYTIWCQGSGRGSVDAPASLCAKVGADGSVRVVGRLADNSVTAFSGGISQADQDDAGAGECAFMAPLYGRRGNFYGTFDFGLGPQQPGTETPQGWLKPWRARDRYYPALPFQTCLGVPIRYNPPPSGQRVTDPFNAAFGDGSVRFIGGVLDGTSNTLFVSERNRVSFPGGNPDRCSISINSRTGWFSGRISPAGIAPTTFYGVFLQGGYGYGRGFSLGVPDAGVVLIEGE
jgi:hypothetical protein